MTIISAKIYSSKLVTRTWESAPPPFYFQAQSPELWSIVWHTAQKVYKYVHFVNIKVAIVLDMKHKIKPLRRKI